MPTALRGHVLKSMPTQSRGHGTRRTPSWDAMSQFFPTADECGRHTIFPGVHIRTCAAERMMLSIVELEPHSVVEEHSHPHEQVGMLLAGRVRFFIGDEEKVLGPGDVWC